MPITALPNCSFVAVFRWNTANAGLVGCWFFIRMVLGQIWLQAIFFNYDLRVF